MPHFPAARTAGRFLGPETIPTEERSPTVEGIYTYVNAIPYALRDYTEARNACRRGDDLLLR